MEHLLAFEAPLFKDRLRQGEGSEKNFPSDFTKHTSPTPIVYKISSRPYFPQN